VNVNEEDYEVDVQPSTSLNEVLREQIGITSVKKGCDSGGCGVCTVLLDNKQIYSCMTPSWRASNKKVLTVDGLSKANELHPLQQGFVKRSASQCGFCVPAMLLVAKEILDESPDPTEHQIRDALCGVLCRCTSYASYIRAIMDVAADRRESEG